MPYQDDAVAIHRLDVFVLAAGAFLVALAVALVCALLVARRRRPPNPGLKEPNPPAAAHTIVQSLESTLAPVTCAAFLTFALAMAGIAALADGGTVNPELQLAIVVGVQLAAVLVVLLLTGRLPLVSDGLERFADVAGFWAVAYHPLGGASYRPAVLRGLRDEIVAAQASRVVLVGHSQGSVLAATAVAGRYEADDARPGPELRLVTCGSPLRSLYARFFPDEFDGDLLAAVRAGCPHGWTNFWRTSDAIASPIAAAGVDDVQLADPRRSDGSFLGHGDYWIDPELLAVVERYRSD